MSKLKVTLNKIYTKVIPQDVRQSEARLRNSLVDGWRMGKRYSKINNKGLTGDMFMRGRAIARNVHVKKDDIPALGVIIGTLSPIPGSFAIGYVVGKGVVKAINALKKIKF